MPVHGRPLVDMKGYAAAAQAPASLLRCAATVNGSDPCLERAARLRDSEFGRFVAASFTHSSDDRLFRSFLARHGVFAGRFFAQRVRERVARAFSRRIMDVEECRDRAARELRWGYAVRGTGGASDTVRLVVDVLSEQTSLGCIEDADTLEGLRRWAIHHALPRRCVLCGQPFSLLDLPDWAYYGANGFKACCLRCRIVQRPEPARLMEMIPAFVSACGFVPTAEASPVSHAFTSRLGYKAWPSVMRLYAALGGPAHAKRLFGSWFAAMAVSGALPEGVLATRKGIRCLAADGHSCHSLEERRIDDFLHARRIPHMREPRYPVHRALNPAGARRADWRVGKTLVEYAGLAGDPAYDQRLDEKILLARQANMEMVVLYPSDLPRLEQRLGRLVGGTHAC